MKKVYLLFIMCLVGMVVPQTTWADEVYTSSTLTITTSDDGKTVTIHSEQAGALWALLEKGKPKEEKEPVINALKAANGDGSKIVFDGIFCSDDLQKLQKNDGPQEGQYDCCVQETVDMENTVFKKRVDLSDRETMNRYKIKLEPHEVENKTDEEITAAFNTKAEQVGVSPQEGDLAVAGNKFYQYSNNQWSETTEPFFASPDRISVCVNEGSFDENKPSFVGAIVNGVPTICQWKQDANYQWNWVPLTSDHAFEDMTFKYWGANVKTAISSKNVSPTDIMPRNLCSNCSALTDLTLSSGSIIQFYEGNKPPLQSLTIGNKVVRLGDGNTGLFADFTSITKLTFEQDGTEPLEIAKECFQRCSGITNVRIPARTTLIETMAFGNTGLQAVTFEPATQATEPMIIKTQAFEGSTSIRDVYVNVSPAKKVLICEYNAFNFNTMDGQTNPTNYNDMATLHFDSNDKEFYKGAWKDGVGLAQEELLAIRGENVQTDLVRELGITDDDNSKLVTVDYANHTNTPVVYEASSNNGYEMGYVKTQRPANGWQQFAKTGNEIPVTGDFLRSYSTATPYTMPTYGTSGQPIVKIYRIWKFDDGYTEGADLLTTNPETKAYAREVKGYIPDHTGLIMVGITESSVLYYFQKYTGEVVKYPFTEKVQGDAESSNLLVPSNADTLTIGPTDMSGGQILYRNFGFKVYDLGTRSEVTRSTKTGKFLRAMKGTKITPNHSYLKLYKDFYHWKNEQGGVSNYDAQIYEEAINNSKISFVYSLDEDDEFGNISTVIRKAIEEADMEDGEYYTLQGVKVDSPTTKGIYIVNGKKVIIK